MLFTKVRHNQRHMSRQIVPNEDFDVRLRELGDVRNEELQHRNIELGLDTCFLAKRRIEGKGEGKFSLASN